MNRATVNTVRPHGSKWLPKADRIAIYDRDEWRCVYCGRDLANEACPASERTVDHVIPAALGGRDVEYHPYLRDYRGDRVVIKVHHTNLVTCCQQCNVKRDQRPISEFCDARTLKRVLTQRYLPIVHRASRVA